MLNELHLNKMLSEDVQLVVRIGKTYGYIFTSDVGADQGNCISPNYIYIAHTLSLSPEANLTDHNCNAEQQTSQTPDTHRPQLLCLQTL